MISGIPEKDVARGVAALRATSAPPNRTGKADGDSSTKPDDLYAELARHTPEYDGAVRDCIRQAIDRLVRAGA